NEGLKRRSIARDGVSCQQLGIGRSAGRRSRQPADLIENGVESRVGHPRALPGQRLSTLTERAEWRDGFRNLRGGKGKSTAGVNPAVFCLLFAHRTSRNSLSSEKCGAKPRSVLCPAETPTSTFDGSATDTGSSAVQWTPSPLAEA